MNETKQKEEMNQTLVVFIQGVSSGALETGKSTQTLINKACLTPRINQFKSDSSILKQAKTLMKIP